MKITNLAVQPEPDHPPLAAWIGIDWADRSHAFTIISAENGAPIQRGLLEQTPEAIAAWAQGLQERFGNRPVGVAVEQARGPLISALAQYSFLKIYPINPAASASYRKALVTSGAKSDASDSDLLAEFLRAHPQRLRPIFLADAQTRLLAELTEDRRKAVDQRTAFIEALLAQLKEYYPLALKVAGQWTSSVGPAFLLKWPTLAQAQAARPQVLRNFYYGHNARARVEERIVQIKAARPLTEDSPTVEAGRRRAQMLARLIQELNAIVKEYDQRIQEIYAAHPDAEIFATLPAGPVMKPRVLAAFGLDRGRYADARALQCYSGIAPVRRSSGKVTTVHARKACPAHLKQTFHEFAQVTLYKPGWARAYYEWKRANGHGHHAAVRALSYKWQRVLVACWLGSQPYDEKTYTKQLTARGVPYLALLPRPEPTAKKPLINP